MAVIRKLHYAGYTGNINLAALVELRILINQYHERVQNELAIPVGDPVDVVAVDTGLVANVEGEVA